MNDVTNIGGQGQQQEEEVVINLGDLSTLLQIIDICAQRGGFQGQELAGVGMLRNKVETFLRQKSPQQQQQPGAEDAVAVEGGSLADKVID